MKTRSNPRPIKAITICAVMIALASILSLMKIITLPLGGSVTPGSLIPILITAFLLGPKWGISSALAFSLIQILFDIGLIVSWGLTPWTFIGCIVFDYILAFTCLGIASFFNNSKPWTIIPAVILSCFGRFICHFLSGVIVFANPTWADGIFEGAIWYSVFYNGSFMGIELIISLAVCSALIPIIPNLRKSIIE